MTVGGSAYLKATVYPEGATNKCITWCSSNTNVATVNPTSGLVMAQGAGTAIIYATAQDGSGSDYCNSELTEKIIDHSNTQTYIEGIKSRIDTLMSTYNGDITRLEYCVSSRNDNPLIQSMGKPNELYEPDYNTQIDKVTGLSFCVHGLWGNQIEVKSYSRTENTYSGTLEFTLYDHFGLDLSDIAQHDETGFRAWYILQHNTAYNGAYKPFVTVIKFEEPFSGTI